MSKLKITATIPAMKPYCYCWEKWDGKTWITTEEFSVSYDDGKVAFKITVGPGFITDGGSVPKPLHDRIGPLGMYLLAFLVHDVLYGCKHLDREIADWILLEIMDYLDDIAYDSTVKGGWFSRQKEKIDRLAGKYSGYSWFKRNAAWRLVRRLGGAAWDTKSPVKVALIRKQIQFELIKT
ncbi:hypothetical protein DRO66_05895 [Candidatus Bathyarchaeota archaeon]|nr:MAG: hypothetical protein DRO66_05895 [Candidatus Bathyarchaeota archaeon]